MYSATSVEPNSSEVSPHKILGLAGGVTKDNYHQRASSYMALHANGEDIGVMIEAAHNPTQWDAWASYFKAKGIKHHSMRWRHVYMVPAKWPQDFDAEWHA
jgi:hypothetical protein